MCEQLVAEPGMPAAPLGCVGMNRMVAIAGLIFLLVPAEVWAEGPPALRKVEVLEVATVSLPAQAAEDGRGNRLEATAPVALDITAERWPGRALDPVLHIGDRTFHEYRFPAPGVMRFVLTEGAFLVDPNHTIFLQYGDDEGSRVEIQP